ncbi:MAG: 16S rRNA (cytosine(1402)-N(4))-methyltransferase [bacterium]|nr:16S rRNA (cytosine(1402)-N(4))-methyltransferase [bacterium]
MSRSRAPLVYKKTGPPASPTDPVRVSQPPQSDPTPGSESSAEPGKFEYHEPILIEEILESAAEIGPRLIVDGTLGDGGHSLGFLQRFPEARLVACDRDPVMLERARTRIAAAGCADRSELVLSNFRDLPAWLAERELYADFVLLDLGVSMFHFRGAGRGFSYGDEGALDMRLDAPGPDRRTAADLLNTAAQGELQKIFQEYGEERFAGRIARAIVEARPLSTARQLAELIQAAVPRLPARPAGRKSSYTKAPSGKSEPKPARKSSYSKSGPGPRQIHPATRVFQALRIAVNDELGAAAAALGADGFPARLASGGRLAVLSFHSLEDRIVKQAFREIGVPAHQRRAAEAEYRILTRKPVPPTDAEIARNPASRSAKLRVLARSAEDNRAP